MSFIINKADPAEMLLTATKELKTLMYKASKIMQGQDVHIEVDRNDEKFFEIIEGTNLFIKIPIAFRLPPVRVFFDYAGNNPMFDLKVCYSRKVKLPNETNSEKIYNKPKMAKLDSSE